VDCVALSKNEKNERFSMGHAAGKGGVTSRGLLRAVGWAGMSGGSWHLHAGGRGSRARRERGVEEAGSEPETEEREFVEWAEGCFGAGGRIDRKQA